MADIHFMIQGKGGVGKSVICALLTQKLLDSGRTVDCFDTDPVNATFHNYKGLGVTFLDIMENGEVNSRKFDDLMESIVATTANAVVIDNGASCFIPLTSYMYQNGAIDILLEHGHNVFIHTVVTGGQAIMDTLAGMAQLCETFAESKAQIVVWENMFWGKVVADNKEFKDMKVYKSNSGIIKFVIKIDEMPAQTDKVDFSDMLSQKLTFKEALASDRKMMVKSRLTKVRNQIYTAIGEFF